MVHAGLGPARWKAPGRYTPPSLPEKGLLEQSIDIKMPKVNKQEGPQGKQTSP